MTERDGVCDAIEKKIKSEFFGQLFDVRVYRMLHDLPYEEGYIKVTAKQKIVVFVKVPSEKTENLSAGDIELYGNALADELKLIINQPGG